MFRNFSPTSEFHNLRKMSQSVLLVDEERSIDDSIDKRASPSSLKLSHCTVWRVEGNSDFRVLGSQSEGDREVCSILPVERRRFLRWVFQKFLISLSVLPGR